MKKIILSALVVAMAATGCKKDKETVCSLDATSIQGTYKITSVKYKLNSSATESQIFTDPNYFEACERDDTYQFAASNVFNYVDAGTACSGSSNVTSTWALVGNALTIGAFGAGTVSSFGCSSMDLTVNDFDVSGDIAVITFSRQ